MTDNLLQNNRTRQSISALRETLQEARTFDDAARIHVALIEICDGLLAHAERQDALIEAFRDDLARKQGIVSNIGGDAYQGATSQILREFASSSNGDRWFLGRDEAGIAHVVHRSNQPSGGAITHIELGVS